MAHPPRGSWPEVERRSAGDLRTGLDRREGLDRRTLPDLRSGERRQIRSTALFVDGYPNRRSEFARRSGEDRRVRERRRRPDRRLEPLFP